MQSQSCFFPSAQETEHILASGLEEKVSHAVVSPEMFYTPASLHSVFSLNYRNPGALHHTVPWESGRKIPFTSFIHEEEEEDLTFPLYLLFVESEIDISNTFLETKKKKKKMAEKKKIHRSLWLNAVIICNFTSDIFS